MSVSLVKPGVFISFIIILITLCALVIVFKPFEKNIKNSEPNQQSLERNQTWSDITATSKIINDNGIDITLPDTDKCSVYTYENPYSLISKPSLTNLFEDLYQGLVHLSTSDIDCIEEDQIVAYNGKHTCIGNYTTSCLDVFGNYLPKNTVEEFAVNCNSVPKCSGTPCNITFNFSQSEETMTRSTLFLNVDYITVSSSNFEELKKDYNYYIEQGIFIEDENLTNNTDYTPKLSNQIYDGFSPNQRFRITRYSYNKDTKKWTENENSYFAEIVFRPGNLFMTMDDDTKNIVFRSRNKFPEAKDRVVWFLAPPLDLNPNKINKATKITNDNLLILSNQYFNDFKEQLFNYKIVKAKESVIPADINYGTKDILSNITDTKRNIDNCIFYISYGKNRGERVSVKKVSDVINYDSYPNLKFQATNSGNPSPTTDFYFGIEVKGLLIDNYDIDKNTGDYKTRFIDLEPSQITQNIINNLKYITFYPTQNSQSQIEVEDILILYWVYDDKKILPGINQNYNSLLQDNQIEWLSQDPTADLAIFPNNYFISKSEGTEVISFTAEDLKSNLYQDPKTGIITDINTNNIDYNNQEFKPGIYRTILNNKTSNLEIEESSSNAVIDIIFGAAEDTKGKNISTILDVIVVDGGEGYKNKTQFDIYSYGISPGLSGDSVKNLILNSTTENYRFISVPLNDNDEPYHYNTDPTTDIKSSDLELDDVKVNGGKLDLGAAKINNNFNGFGYQNNDLVYINQLDKFGNSVLGEKYNPDVITKDDLSDLAVIKVQTQNRPSGVSFTAPYDLLRTEPYEEALTNSDLIYNFWNDSTGEYTKSPPQFVYVGSENETLAESVEEAGDLGELIKSDKAGSGQFITTLLNLKSLQFQELNYTGKTSDNLDENVIANNNIIKTESNLILGRFIPYSTFKPPVFANGDNNIPTGKPTKIFFNNNYTQIVPYGIKNIYNTILSPSKLPSI